MHHSGTRSDSAFVLGPDERAALRQDIDLDAFERLLAMLPPPARELLLRLAAREPDLLAIWEAAPALRLEERGPFERGPQYENPHLQMYVVPRLEDVSLSDPVLQEMLRAVFPAQR
ncbi:MAG TPA: hypothetical protein VF041_13025 [Gemmatimonadaceae bacterium]